MDRTLHTIFNNDPLRVYAKMTMEEFIKTANYFVAYGAAFIKIYKIEKIKYTFKRTKVYIKLFFENDKIDVQMNYHEGIIDKKLEKIIYPHDNVYVYKNIENAVKDIKNRYKHDNRILQGYENKYKEKLKYMNKYDIIKGEYVEYFL